MLHLSKAAMTKNQKEGARRERGVSIVEFAAAVMLGVPLIIALIYVICETSFYFAIKTNLDVSARQAARQLAIKYGQDPTIAGASKTDPRVSAIYTQAFIGGFVSNVCQFSDPNFVGGSTGTVTVVVQYPGGNPSIPAFPNPDPLNMRNHFSNINSIATFAVE